MVHIVFFHHNNTNTKMIELYRSKVKESSETEQAGKYYARVSYKQTLNVQDMAKHMAEHNTPSDFESPNTLMAGRDKGI